SACFRIDRIWLSEKRDFFMQNLPAGSLRKILLLSTAIFRGDYQRTPGFRSSSGSIQLDVMLTPWRD
ncbi:hypothetical protein, partial [Marinobacter halodurans]|uniref:hypothetical protein n=1 Tax=Marinobacter halodurans TaxID=2528979 RepID=UPI001A95499A